MPDYPYMPSDRHLKYVPHDNPFMLVAAKARAEQSGDPLYPVGIAIVRDGQVLVIAGNGFSRGAGTVHICPRIVLECPSGTGYDLCTLHDAPGHAEQMAVKTATEQGIDLTGADAYMYGHWWACEPCWTALINAGIRDLYVTDDAHERFSRENVFAETLKPSVQSSYISGPMTTMPEEEHVPMRKLYESLADSCLEVGIKPYVPHMHCDPRSNDCRTSQQVWQIDVDQVHASDVLVADVTYTSLGVGGELAYAQMAGKPIVLLSKKGSTVSRFALGNPAVVYHIEYNDHPSACRMLKNVLRQL